MSLVNILLWLVFGAVAGFIAGRLMGNASGLIGNIILGIIGSFVGGWVASLLGINVKDGFNIVSLLVAIGGACLLIFLGRILFNKR